MHATLSKWLSSLDLYSVESNDFGRVVNCYPMKAHITLSQSKPSGPRGWPCAKQSKDLAISPLICCKYGATGYTLPRKSILCGNQMTRFRCCNNNKNQSWFGACWNGRSIFADVSPPFHSARNSHDALETICRELRTTERNSQLSCGGQWRVFSAPSFSP